MPWVLTSASRHTHGRACRLVNGRRIDLFATAMYRASKHPSELDLSVCERVKSIDSVQALRIHDSAIHLSRPPHVSVGPIEELLILMERVLESVFRSAF